MIRIPRKKKKHYSPNLKLFPHKPIIERYYAYFDIEYGIKKYKMSAENLCNTFGRYLMDDVIWWAWIRWKKLGIKPELSPLFKGYWDWFVSKGVINEIE